MTAKQDVSTQSDDYARYLRELALVEIMMDEHELKQSCIGDKGGAGSYLRMPISYTRKKADGTRDAEKEQALYGRYVEHAYLPEHIVSDAAEEMVGICFKSEPDISLPDKIRPMERHANSRGDSLQAVAEDALRDLLTSRRACISTDYVDGRAVIEHKPGKSLINYRKNSSGYTMMVFSETYTEGDESGEQRRHYSIESGILVVTVFRQDDNGEWAEHIELDENGNAVPQPTLPNNKPFEYIPIRVAETVKPALLGMARTVWKGYKVSADYYGMLHTLTPTLVIQSDKSATALAMGFENGIHVGSGDSVALLQQGVDGADPLRTAMETLFNSAVDQGVRLVSESTKAESGEALYLRNSNKQIKADSVANEVSTQIEEALRVAAILENANPDEVSFEIEAELIENPVDVENLKEMREAVVDGQLIRHEDYVLQAFKNGLIELDVLDDGSLDVAGYVAKVRKEFKAINEAAEVI